MTARIHRGFHRIGVVLAVPLVLIGAFEASYELWWGWSTRKAYEGFVATIAEGAATRDAFDRLMIDSYAPHAADYSMPILLVALALALYAAARAVGWILAGFIGSDRP